MMFNTNRYFMPTDIRFGKGTLSELKTILPAGSHAFVVTDPGIVKAGIVNKVIAILAATGSKATVFDGTKPSPTAQLTLEAAAKLKESGADVVLAIGGGSSLDVGKVIAALATNDGTLEDYQWNRKPFENPPLPFIAIPTTAGTGSEVTRVAVIVDRDEKKGINSDRLFPNYAIIDPEVMVGLPAMLTASTGLDALTHAIEAYVGIGSNPFTDSFALEAIRLIGKSFWKAVAFGGDVQAREDMALASTLAGVAMDQAGLGIIHSMAGPFCTYFGMPHGEACAVLLKYGMRFNLMTSPEKFAAIAKALGCETAGLSEFEAGCKAVEAVDTLMKESGLKIDLQGYGLKRTDVDRVSENTLDMFLIRNNPRKVSAADCRAFYLGVMDGEGVE